MRQRSGRGMKSGVVCSGLSIPLDGPANPRGGSAGVVNIGNGPVLADAGSSGSSSGGGTTSGASAIIVRSASRSWHSLHLVKPTLVKRAFDVVKFEALWQLMQRRWNASLEFRS